MKMYVLLFAWVAFAFGVHAQNTAAIPVPRTFPTNWMARHEALVAQAKQGYQIWADAMEPTVVEMMK